MSEHNPDHDHGDHHNLSTAQSLLGPYGRHIRQMFYLVTPAETSYASLEEMPSLMDQAIPWFVVLILLDLFFCWKKGLTKRMYNINDFLTSVGAGFMQMLITRVAFRTVEVSLYVYVYENWCIYSLPWDNSWTWLAAFVAVDFGYYWLHRASHEINILWSFHQTHHSSEYYNMSTALRQGVFQQYMSIFFYLPQALFIPPTMHVAHEILNRFYQYWIHTPLIGEMGPAGWLLNTPSHHRVHHGRNRYCIDKNYAGTLIVWDRLFGTFQPELREEPVVYGLTHNINTFDAAYVQLHHLKNVWDKFLSVQGTSDKIKSLIFGPGWSPGQPRMGDPMEIPEIEYPVVKYDSGVAKWVSRYVLFQGTMVLIAYQIYSLQANVTPWITRIQFAAAMVGLIYHSGSLMQRKPFSPHVEVIRCTLFAYWLLPMIWPPHLDPVFLRALQAIQMVCALFWIAALTNSRARKIPLLLTMSKFSTE